MACLWICLHSRHAKGGQEGIRVFELTELAVGRSGRVTKVPSGGTDVVGHVRLASLTARGLEEEVFTIRTYDAKKNRIDQFRGQSCGWKRWRGTTYFVPAIPVVSMPSTSQVNGDT